MLDKNHVELELLKSNLPNLLHILTVGTIKSCFFDDVMHVRDIL